MPRRILVKRSLQRLALIGGGLCVGLLVAEGLSRLVDEDPWYDRLLREQLDPKHRENVKRNALGLRDRDHASPKPPGTTRILLLGDSFTFGCGVPDDTAVFPELLERQLDAELSRTGRRIEILNGGMPGSLTRDWVQLQERVKDSFQPDITVVVFFLRDGTLTHLIGGFFSPIRTRIATRNQESWLYRSSHLYRLLRDPMDRRTISDGYANVMQTSYFGRGPQMDEWRQAQANLRTIQAVAARGNSTTALVVFPVLVELNDHYPFKNICDLLVRFGHELGVPTFDLLPAFLGHDGPALWVSPRNPHPNPEAHRIAADALLPFFRDLLKR